MKHVTTAIIILTSLCTTWTQTAKRCSLEECINLALGNNIAMTKATLEDEAAAKTKKSVFTRFFPSINLQLTSFKMLEPLIDLTVPEMNLPVYNGDPAMLGASTQFAYFPATPVSLLGQGGIGLLTAAQPLFAGGRIINSYRLASIGKEVAQYRLQLAKNEVLLSVEQQYWQLVALQEKFATQVIYGEMLDTLYKEANDAFNAGLISRNDLLKIAIKQSDVKATRLRIENGIRVARMAFCQYLGLPGDSLLSPADSTVVYKNHQSIYADPDSSVRKRTEYALLQKAYAAEQLQTKIRRGEYLPEIGIGAGGIYLKDLGNDGMNGIIFATVKIPVTGWWEASHTIEERKIRESITRKNNENSVEMMRIQVEKAWSTLDEKYMQIGVAGKKVDQTAENLRFNRASFSAGLCNVSDLLEAQVMHMSARDDLLSAQIDYKINYVAYLQLTGR